MSLRSREDDIDIEEVHLLTGLTSDVRAEGGGIEEAEKAGEVDCDQLV